MTEILTFDQAYLNRRDPRWQGRPVGTDRWIGRDTEDDSFFFYRSSDGRTCNVQTGDVWEFRLKPEPREWWEVRIGRSDSVEAFFCDCDSARKYVLAEQKAGTKFSYSYMVAHCREVLDDGPEVE